MNRIERLLLIWPAWVWAHALKLYQRVTTK